MSYKDSITFDNLYHAGKKVCNNVRWKNSVVGFENNILRNTLNLQNELIEGKYKISPYQKFKVYEPKERDIVATRIRDRQFQRSLCSNSFYDEITKGFIHDNCACLTGKSVDFALNRITAFLRKFRTKNGKEGYVLNLDIHHYFQSIDHEIAKGIVEKKVKDTETVKAVCKIIDSFDEGLGLGSQISQLVALAYIDSIDHFIKEQLHIKYYIRFMDDMLLIHESKDYLIECKNIIIQELSKLKLTVNEDKTRIYPIRQGVKFLKWRFEIVKSGKIVRRIDKKKLGNRRRKLDRIMSREAKGDFVRGTTKSSLVSWKANAERGNTYYQRAKMTAYYYELENKYGFNRNENGEIGADGREPPCGTRSNNQGSIRKSEKRESV